MACGVKAELVGNSEGVRCARQRSGGGKALGALIDQGMCVLTSNKS
jgi:hypothetical protein